MEHKEDIINRIGEKRYLHSIRVMEVAEKLAKIHSENIEKAKIAAYYHDCAKIRDNDILIKTAVDYNLQLNDDMKKAPQIIHGYLGAIIANKLYGINDKEILDAIRNHTTGCENMTKLDKIIFLSDYIEPMRNFSGVEEARKLAEKDLDEAMLFALNNTMEFLLNKNEYIALETLKARNFILENK